MTNPDSYDCFIQQKLRIVKDKLQIIKKLEELPQSHLIISQKQKIEKKSKLLQAQNFYENSLKLYADFGKKISGNEEEYKKDIEKLKTENKEIKQRLDELKQEGNLQIHLRDILRLYFLPQFIQLKESKEIEQLNNFSERIFNPKPRIPFLEVLKSSMTELNLYLEQSQDEAFQNYSYERLYYAVQKVTQNDKFQNAFKLENKANFEEKKVSWVDINDCLDEEEEENKKQEVQNEAKSCDNGQEKQTQKETEETAQYDDKPNFQSVQSQQQQNYQQQQPYYGYKNRGRYRKRYPSRAQYNYYY